MSSGWEIASDIAGGFSAVLLLLPAFGANKVAKLVTGARNGLKKFIPHDSRAVDSEDVSRFSKVIDKLAQSTQRWSTWDELILRAAAVLLVASFAAKGVHHWIA